MQTINLDNARIDAYINPSTQEPGKCWNIRAGLLTANIGSGLAVAYWL
jgi:hypothetical protein